MNAKRRVLLVEDESKIAKVVGEHLQLAGFDVTTAIDGDAALTAAYAVQPDVIVLDLTLPKRSGLEVCRTLRHDPKFQQLPIVLFTGKELEDVVTSFGTDEQLLRDWGADAYVHKVDGAPALIRQIHRLLWKAANPGDAPHASR